MGVTAVVQLSFVARWGRDTVQSRKTAPHGHHAALDASEPCPMLLCGLWQPGL